MLERRKSILIIDSNIQAKELYSSLLALHKITAYFCSEGIDPLAHARRLSVDGIILSIDPPIDPDLETISRLKKHKDLKEIPLMIVTAHLLETALTRIKKMGCPKILLKPFSINDFQKFLGDIF